MKIKSLLIANRGEIAVRIIKAAKVLDIRTVQIYSSADADSMAVKMADEAIEIGPPPAAKSYLNIDAVLMAALSAKVDAVHPGYGFLSESAEFSDAVTANGMIFIGPDGDSIKRLGDKVTARKVAEEAGVPTVPGSDGRVVDVTEGLAIIEKIGYPVMIKASAGGGGRGIRVVENSEEFTRFFPQASTEAAAAFGDGGMYIERFIRSSRHIEVQVVGDGTHYVHCYERECSLQRRRQKVWEEAPAVGLPPEIREKLCNSAVELARSVGYEGVGTVEFLYDDNTQQYYFIEVNTRIQVEHPITEMITGIDLVQTMLTIAGGEPLSVKQEDISIKGHAIECRINAEDPFKNFQPWPGCVSDLSIPEEAHVRFDTMLYAGYMIPPYYDSLLGKLIVWGEDRNQCLSHLRYALSDIKISGIPTTIPLHLALVDDKQVIEGRFDTNYLEKWLDDSFMPSATEGVAV